MAVKGKLYIKSRAGSLGVVEWKRMWELDHKEGWAPKNWCFQPVVLEKTFKSLLDSKEINQSILKETNLWIIIGRPDAEAEAPVPWPPDVRCQLIGKDLDSGKDWRQEEKRATEDEIVGWYPWLNGHELDKTLGNSEIQGSLACCSPWGRNESRRLSDWTIITFNHH